MYAYLLLEKKDLCKGDISLAEMLDCLHQESGMSSLLGHQTENEDWVDLLAYFVLVQIQMQLFQIIADRVKHTQKKWQLAFDQVNLDSDICLQKLLVQLDRLLYGTWDVYQLRELELEVFF